VAVDLGGLAVPASVVVSAPLCRESSVGRGTVSPVAESSAVRADEESADVATRAVGGGCNESAADEWPFGLGFTVPSAIAGGSVDAVAGSGERTKTIAMMARITAAKPTAPTMPQVRRERADSISSS